MTKLARLLRYVRPYWSPLAMSVILMAVILVIIGFYVRRSGTEDLL